MASYRKAEGAWRNAQRIADLDEQLFTNDALARRELDQARTDLAAATADREAALSQLRSLGVGRGGDRRDSRRQAGLGERGRRSARRSPGRWSRSSSRPGQLLQAGTTPCFTIADLSTVWVMANVFESDLGAVRRGETALVTTDAAPDTLPGRVDYVGRSGGSRPPRPPRCACWCRTTARLLRRDMLVRRDDPRRSRRATASWCRSRRCCGTTRTCRSFTWRRPGGFARRRIDLGGRVGDRYEIASGLKPGERW